MDLSKRFSTLLAAVSPELVAEDGYCALTVDARQTVHVALDEASGAIVLWANFPLDSRDDTLTKRLLHANFFWQGTGGATWSLDPSTNIPMLAERLAVEQWDNHDFESLLQRFADRALAWQNELGEPAHSAAAPAPFPTEPFGNPFLRA